MRELNVYFGRSAAPAAARSIPLNANNPLLALLLLLTHNILMEGVTSIMPKCELCGNDYDKSFQVIYQGEYHTFDSFECAIQQLAPTCSHCTCRIIGHGIESAGQFYCCAHCASMAGVKGAKDRV